jgi:hypothetical protein
MSLRRMANLNSSDINYTDDYIAPTWSNNSFNFDATNNIFTGNSTTSTTINNAIVGSNKQWTIAIWARRSTGAQILFCRDKSSATSARQFNVFFNASNKLLISLYTNSSNFITFTSTASFADSRAWNQYVFVYDGTQSATNRLTVYVNGQVAAGSTTQTGTFTTINNITTPNVNIGGRADAASFSSTKINQVALFNTNLSAVNVSLLYNIRVPFDIRTNATLNANLVMFLSADTSSVFSTNWAWTDLVGGGVFTSSGMVVGDLIADAPALKQIKVIAICGQSNAGGRVPMAQLDSKYVGGLTWCKAWNGTTELFENINSTTNNNQWYDPTNEYGVEYYLANKINKYNKKTTYIFKVAVGGTYLSPLYSPSWCIPTPGVQPSGGTIWQHIYNTDLVELQDWELFNGYTITDIRFVWIQGEGDSLNLDSSTTYETNWINYLASVVNGRINSFFYITPKVYDCLLSANQDIGILPYKANVNTAKINAAATNPTNYKTVNTDTCETNSSIDVHYSKNGNITLANLIADLIITDGI